MIEVIYLLDVSFLNHFCFAAIETCRKETSFPEKSESFEHTSNGGPRFEEFIPMKNVSSFSLEKHEQRKDDYKGKNVVSSDDCSDDKSTKLDWLKSVQLWKHTPVQPTDEVIKLRRYITPVKLIRLVVYLVDYVANIYIVVGFSKRSVDHGGAKKWQ